MEKNTANAMQMVENKIKNIAKFFVIWIDFMNKIETPHINCIMKCQKYSFI